MNIEAIGCRSTTSLIENSKAGSQVGCLHPKTVIRSKKDTWVVWCTGGGVLRVWVPRHQTAFIIDPTTHSVIKRSSRKKRKVPDRLSLCAGTKNWGINNLTLGIRTSNHSQPFHVGPKIPKELRITCSIWCQTRKTGLISPWANGEMFQCPKKTHLMLSEAEP